MRIKIYHILPLVAVMVIHSGCTDEIPSETQPENLLEVDLTGEWSAYGYIDLNGRVPVEVVRIEQTGENNEYTATKIIGDNAVPSGHVTWSGNYTSNPFIAEIWYGDGLHFSSSKDQVVRVLNANTIYIETTSLYFVRRTDGYFP